MTISWTALAVINAVFLGSAVLFLLDFWRGEGAFNKPANRALVLGFLLSTLFLLYQSADLNVYVPVMGLSQALFFFSWSLVAIYLPLSWKLDLRTFGVVLVPLVLAMSGSAFVFYHRPALPAPAFLHDVWFAVHVLAAFFAYAGFALSFIGALLYLVQNRELKLKRTGTFYHKLPPLEVLETVVYRTIILGFPLLTVAIASGLVWTKEVYGEFWRWDPKILLTLVTWLIYLAILSTHYVFMIRGRKVVLISIFAFCCVLCTFLGVNFLEGSVHNFLR